MKNTLPYLLIATALLSSGCRSSAAQTSPAPSPTPAADGIAAPNADAVQALVKKVKASLRALKAGTFEMGDWGNEEGLPYDFEPDSKPVHKVTLDSFSMMAYKVTYEDFDAFTDAVGKERVDMDRYAVKYRSPKRPAGVSWYGADAYCKWLGEKTGMAFALPTEAQWEYAARAGGQKLMYATDNGKIDRGRNYPPKWEDGPEPQMLDVGTYPPNPAGLYGMSEETVEWVGDWYDPKYYKISPSINPTGPASGTKKVRRGLDGTSAEAFALVFMRVNDVPQPLDVLDDLRHAPLPGYSGNAHSAFRCVVNNK